MPNLLINAFLLLLIDAFLFLLINAFLFLLIDTFLFLLINAVLFLLIDAFLPVHFHILMFVSYLNSSQGVQLQVMSRDLSCKVYVGDVAPDATEKELEREFSYYGK